jgi:hypothetical protein
MVCLPPRKHLTRIGAWLRERKIGVVCETETARLTQSIDTTATGHAEELPNPRRLESWCLGGDGTLLAMASPHRSRLTGTSRFSASTSAGFGFLTELRIDELFPGTRVRRQRHLPRTTNV